MQKFYLATPSPASEKKKRRFRENVESKVTPERRAVDGEEEQTT